MSDFIIRNGDDKWDKPIVVADNVDDYYRKLKDKRLFNIPYVVMIEETDNYILIKNSWKYDDKNMMLCRDLNGSLFNVLDIEYVKVKESYYLKFAQIEDINRHIIITWD